MRTYEPWLDLELTDLIRSEPDLVAIADALAEAGSERVGVARSSGRRRWLAWAAVALAAAAVAALVVPWGGSRSGLTERALAAIGTDPVLHVVIELPPNARLVEVATGKSTMITTTNEIWYDRDKGLVHTLFRSGGVVVGDTLQTPEGGYSESGPIYDCAWIAAHPRAATKAGVSCNADGDNGTTPRKIERPAPTIDPPLAAFLDGYRDAVARGEAHQVDGGELDGKRVLWLSFSLADGRSEEVALDPATYRPLYARMPGGGWEYRIRSIESVPFDEANFKRPKLDERAVRIGSGGVFDRSVVELNPDSLATAYPEALWAGRLVVGLPLVAIYRDELTSRYGTGAIDHGVGVRLFYGSMGSNGSPDRSQPFIEIDESGQPQPAYRWLFVRGAPPPEGKLYVPGGSGSGSGFMVKRGVYVSIWASDSDLALAAAQALEPLSHN